MRGWRLGLEFSDKIKKIIRNMAFPSGAITLSAICDAYGVPRNMSALRGKLYYTANGSPVTVPSTGAIDMGQFRGTYKSVVTGTLTDRSFSGHKYNSSYTIAGTKLVGLTINFFEENRKRGASVSSGNNSGNAYIVADGTTISSSMGTKTFTLNASSTLSIYVWTQASDNLGQQCAAGGLWNFTISSNGLTFTTYTNYSTTEG